MSGRPSSQATVPVAGPAHVQLVGAAGSTACGRERWFATVSGLNPASRVSSSRSPVRRSRGRDLHDLGAERAGEGPLAADSVLAGDAALLCAVVPSGIGRLLKELVVGVHAVARRPDVGQCRRHGSVDLNGAAHAERSASSGG